METGFYGFPGGAVPPGAGGGSSIVLAVRAYASGSDTSISSSSTIFTDVDATNQAVTFIAPASGNVLVRVSGVFTTNNFTNNVYIDLREGSTDLTGTSRVLSVGSGVYVGSSFSFYLSGISGGSHTYKLGFKGGASTNALVTTGPNLGQTVYEVWSAP